MSVELSDGAVALVAAVMAAAALVVAGHRVRLRLAPQRPLPHHAGSQPTDRRDPTGRSPGRSTAAIVGAAALVAVVVIAGPLAALVLSTATIAVRRLRPMRADRRRRSLAERDLPAAMDLLVLSVRAGLTPQQAFGELATTHAGPVGEAFAEVVRRTQRGQPFADALGALGELLGPRAGALADVIATSDRHGLALGPTLDQLALEAAATRQRLDQADARRLPVKLSFPLVACTLPSFVLLAIVPAMIAALSSLGGSAW
jgi:tight adherence protein C